MTQKPLTDFTSTEETLKTDGGEDTTSMNTTSDKPGMTVAELNRRLYKCADMIRGNVSKEKYKNVISPVLFLYSFETRVNKVLEQAPDEEDSRDEYLKAKFGYVPPKDNSLDSIKATDDNVAESLDSWFREFQDLNGEDLLDKTYQSEDGLTDEVLHNLLDKVEEIDFENTPADLLGEAYMNMMKRFAHEEGGEYFTPPKYSNLLARSVYALGGGFEPESTFHDPTAGSAGLLLEAASLVRDDPDEVQERDFEDLGEIDSHHFTGQELDPQIYKIGLMNLSVHGMADADLRRGDSLGDPQFTNGDDLEQFDYILANFPFSQDWPKDKYKDGDKYGRFDWHSKLPRANRGDYAFIMHMFAQLKESGRMATVVPHGVLYRSGEQRYRDYLLKNDYVEAVLSLPGKMFESTSAPTAILILNKDKPAEHEDEVLFVNADVEDRFYYDTGNSRNELLDEGVEELCQILKEWRTEERVSRAVSTEEIAEFDNNLTLSLYVDTTEPQPEIDLDEVQARHDQLLDDCVQLNEQIKTQINNLEL